MQTKIPNSDSVVAGMDLAAALIGLLVAVLGLIQFIASRSKKERPRVITIAFRIGANILLLAGVVAYFLGVDRLGLLFYVFATVVTSIDYVRQIGPAERVETLVLIVSWVTIGSLAVMNLMSRIVDQMGQLIDLVKRLVH